MNLNITAPVPPKSWHYKNRSQKTDGGFFSRLRGSGSWQRRCVCIENYALSYSEAVDGEKLKTIPLQELSACEKVPKERMLKEECPSHLSDCGWSFSYQGTVVLLAASTPEVRDVFVNYLEAFLQALQTRNASQASGAGAAAATAGGGGGADGDADGEDGQSHHAAAPATGGMTLAAMAAAAASGNAVGILAGVDPRAIAGDDDENNNNSASDARRARRNFTADQLKSMMGGDDEDAAGSLDWNGEELGDDEDDDDDDDDDSDEDGSGGGGSGGGRKKKRSAVIVDAPRLIIERQLRQLAKTPHNHIAFKLEKYKDNFEDGDTMKDVVFSRPVYKISQKNNNDDRDLVVTTRKLYMFSIGGLLDRVSVRSFPINQIVGVVESTETHSLLAILIPCYHDLLIRIAPQNSVVGGTEAEVKTQLIAHLFVNCTAAAPGRQFLFREAANVPSIIRRSEDDEHQPLRSEEADRFRIASKPELFPKFRVNAESVVYLSVHVQRVNAEMSYSPRIFVLTDGGFYLIHTDMEKIAKRSSLTDVSNMRCDPEMHGVLLELPEMDMVVYAKTQQDYQLIVRWVVEAAMRGCRHPIRVSQSRNLLHGARLQDAKNLMDKLAGAGVSTEEGFKNALKAAQRFGRATLHKSKEGLGWMGKHTENLVTGSADLMKQAGSGIGSLLMDNAITGELRGFTEGMLSIAGASSSRVVSERIVRLADVHRYCELREPTTDSLKMAGTQALTTFAQSNKDKTGDISIIYFSARCKHYALTSSVETSKSSDMFILLTGAGILLFNDHSGSTTSILTGSKTLFSRAFNAITGGQMGLSLHEFVPWSETRGVMRCSTEPNLVGIFNSTSATTLIRDLMIRLPNAKLAECFIAHFMNLFAATQTPPPGRGFWKTLPGYYTAATGEHLRRALKGSAFEPDATIALRLHPLGGDELHKAVDPMIVDRVRRYGDNSVRFSSPAWRLKTSTMRKDASQAIKASAASEATEAGSAGAGLDKKLFKACELMLTNCAVYQFEEDGKVVNRRLELLEITRVKRCASDPDGVLLVVPRQFDFYIRVEGRMQEFIDRLVEARNEWSDYELDLPVEIDRDTFLPISAAESEHLHHHHHHSSIAATATTAKSPTIVTAGGGAAQGAATAVSSDVLAAGGVASSALSIRKTAPLPVETIAESLTSVGRLVKPKTFSAEQDAIVSDEVFSQYRSMMTLEIRRTLEEKESSPTFSCSSGPEAAAVSAAVEKAAGEYSSILHFERAIARVRFATERAFTFGLRPSEPECATLALGLVLLEYYKRWGEILTKLQRAVRLDLLAEFQAAENDGRTLASSIQQKFSTGSVIVAHSFVDAITSAVELMKPQLEAMKSRSVVKSDIERLVQRAAKDGPEGVLADLEESVLQAQELGVHAELLDGIRASFDAAVQAFRMNRIAAHAWSPILCDVFDEAQASIVAAAGGTGGVASAAPHGHSHGAEAHQDQNITWSLRCLTTAVDAGDLHQLDFALRAVEISWASNNNINNSNNNTGVKGGSVALPDKVRDAVVRARQLANELRRHEPVLNELKRVSDSFRRNAGSLNAEELARYETEFADVLQQLPRNVPSLRAARDTAFVLFSTVQLRRKAAEQQEEAILEERALAAAYSKSANDDAIASAQRYERAQRVKQEVQRQERRDEINDVAKRGSTLLFDVKRAVAAEDADRVTALANTIDSMRAQMQAMLSRCTSDSEIQSLDDVVLVFNQNLDEALALAQVFEDQNAAKRGAAAVPPEALSAAQRLNADALCAFVESGELDIASLKVLGEVWNKAAQQKKQLHRLRQRAFVLDVADDDAVAQLMNDAAVMCVENDVVIAKVREQNLLAKKKNKAVAGAAKQQQQQSTAAAAAAKKPAAADASSSSPPSPAAAAAADEGHQQQQHASPKLVPPAVYNNSYPWQASKGGGVFLDVYGALSAMLRKDGIVESAKESGRYEFPAKDVAFANDVKDFCARMERFFTHRVKPSGFFRKTPRSFFDTITELGKIKRGDTIVAPFCSHLAGEFERVKKLNNANGLSSDQVLVRLILSKRGDLQRMFDELATLTAKERENLYEEDSVWRVSDDVASKDMALFSKMVAQIVWPFSFTDRRNAFEVITTCSSSSSSSAGSGGGGLSAAALAGLAANSSSLTGNPSLSNAGNNSNADNLMETSSVAPSAIAAGLGAGGPTAEQAMIALRNSVRVLGNFFQGEMRRLGVESTAEQRRQLFDETRTKMCGVLVREEICAAIALLFRSGVKVPTGIFSRFKRAPWDVVVAATDSVRKSAHELSAVALPEAVDSVMSLTDPSNTSSSRRGQSAVSKMNATQLTDVRFRIFLCFALNRKILSNVVLKAMFDQRTSTGAELTEKFYDGEKNAFLDPEYRGEIAKIFEYLEKLPFTLSLDAEIW